MVPKIASPRVLDYPRNSELVEVPHQSRYADGLRVPTCNETDLGIGESYSRLSNPQRFPFGSKYFCAVAGNRPGDTRRGQHRPKQFTQFCIPPKTPSPAESQGVLRGIGSHIQSERSHSSTKAGFPNASRTREEISNIPAFL